MGSSEKNNGGMAVCIIRGKVGGWRLTCVPFVPSYQVFLKRHFFFFRVKRVGVFFLYIFLWSFCEKGFRDPYKVMRLWLRAVWQTYTVR